MLSAAVKIDQLFSQNAMREEDGRLKFLSICIFQRPFLLSQSHFERTNKYLFLNEGNYNRGKGSGCETNPKQY